MMIDQVVAWIHQNLLGVIVGVIATVAVAALWRLAMRLLKFARAYGLRQLAQTAKEVFLHVTAYPTIKADPVLTVGYVANLVASQVVNATVCILCAVVSLADIAEATWLRWLLGIASLVFAYRTWKRYLGVSAFYTVTAGRAIEEVKKSNPLLKQWYGIKDKKPFPQIGKPQPASESSEIKTVVPTVKETADTGRPVQDEATPPPGAT